MKNTCSEFVNETFNKIAEKYDDHRSQIKIWLSKYAFKKK